MAQRFPTLKDSAGLRYTTFFYLYAMQGIPAGFALTALANFLIGKGATAMAIGYFDAIIGLPWILQFVWGPVIDRFQYSAMGHRKHWIIFSQVLTVLITACLLFVKAPVAQINLIAVIFVFHSIAASIQDTAVDATAITVVPTEQMGRVNAFMRLGMLLGTAVGAAGFSTLLHLYGFYYAALSQILILLLFTIITYIIKVDRTDSYIPSLGITRNKKQPSGTETNPGIKWLFGQLYKGIIRRESMEVFLLVAVVYLCMSVFIRSLTFHLIHNLHWDDNRLSVLQGTWGSLVSAVVILTGGVLADRLGPQILQRWVLVSLVVFLIGFGAIGWLWVHPPVSTAGVILYSFADPLFSVASVPILMALCLPRVEGSQFTTYMAIANLCDVAGAYISGKAMSVTTGPVVGVCCGVIILTGMILTHVWKRRNGLASLKVVPAK